LDLLSDDLPLIPLNPVTADEIDAVQRVHAEEMNTRRRPLSHVHFYHPSGKEIGNGITCKADRLLEFSGGRIDRLEVRRRAGNAMARNLPTHRDCKNTSDTWAIVGGGPSINQCVDEIRALKRRGANIVSVNKSHDWLLDKGIVPWGHVLLDPKEWVSEYVQRPRKDVRYFVASQCHDKTFDSLKGYPVFLWHAGQDFDDGPEPTTYLREHWPTKPWFIVPGPTTVGLRTLCLGAAMDSPASKFHFFGLDSSRLAESMHGYAKPEPPDAKPGNVMAKHKGKGYVFQTNTHMARQWADFDKLVKELPEHINRGRLPKNLDMTFHGSGLLNFYAATLQMHHKPECNEDPSKVGGYIDVITLPDRRTLLGTRAA
jgi:hypothetical protein